jgi:hypothetical protein
MYPYISNYNSKKYINLIFEDFHEYSIWNKGFTTGYICGIFIGIAITKLYKKR